MSAAECEGHVWTPCAPCSNTGQPCPCSGGYCTNCPAPTDPTERVTDGNGREVSLLEAALFNANAELADDADDYTIGRILATAALRSLRSHIYVRVNEPDVDW